MMTMIEYKPERRWRLGLQFKLAAGVAVIAFAWKSAQAFYIVDLATELLRPVQPRRALLVPPHALIQLASSPSASDEEKTDKLRAFLDDDTTPLSERLYVARRYMDKRSKVPGAEKVCAPFLLREILKGGPDFCRKTPHRITAVGEYAFLSDGFEGYDRNDFEQFKDKRVIPVLRRCLYAPDTIFGKEQGCVIRGLPWQTDGRNTGRQHIPVALARLRATEAIPDLKWIWRHHHDPSLRPNAVYALGALLDRKESRKLEDEIKRAGSGYLTRFGEGLIARGDPDGVALLLGFPAEPTQATGKGTGTPYAMYVLSLRMDVLKGLHGHCIEPFYRGALEHPPLRQAFIARPAFWTAQVYAYDEERKTYGNMTKKMPDRRTAETYHRLTNAVATNHLVTLAPLIENISAETQDPEIRKLSKACLEELK